MLIYALIGLSLVLTGIAGLQFSYMFYIERLYRDRQAYLRDLEKRHARLQERLEAAEIRIAEQDELIEATYPDLAMDEEAWADVIEDR
ncbi:hypothetical protein BH10ACI3_BH10ACI3_29000 [soil metagenome]